ncbi:MAG: SDR family oxidoreductase [Chloroflexi bacterium]|nr:SDR family oxidoreductase [Chloroflexota bacterium]
MSAYQFDLSGRAALVTGGGIGGGRDIALALAASGAAVAVNDINIERADFVAEAISADGGSAISLGADIANRFQAAAMIERARDAFGRIHILVNATSIFHAEPMLTVDEWNWRRQIDVNMTGAFFCLQLIGRVMADEGGGSIINLASAEACQSSLPEGIGYVASQAGIIGMTRQAARELAPHDVRVNCIASEMGANPSPDCAAAALYLCSDGAKSVTGQLFVINGGNAIQG